MGSCSPQEGEEGPCAELGCSALGAALTDKSQVRKKISRKVGGNKTGAASGVQQRHLRRPCLGSAHQHPAVTVRELSPRSPGGS